MFLQINFKFNFLFLFIMLVLFDKTYSMDQFQIPSVKSYLEHYVTINNRTRHRIEYELSSELKVISGVDAYGFISYQDVPIYEKGIIPQNRGVCLPKRNGMFVLDSDGESTIVKPIFGGQISLKVSFLAFQKNIGGYTSIEEIFADNIIPGVYDVRPIKRDLK